MSGYWNLPDESAEALRGGWFHTGDAGTMDDDGYIYIQDRVKDMIVSGGENIYPRVIEDVLFSHPAIADAAVIGVPDEQWGETVKAIVVLRQGATAGEEEIIDFCRGKLGGFERPRSVDFIDELPRNLTGKVLKRELREPHWAGHRRRVAGAQTAAQLHDQLGTAPKRLRGRRSRVGFPWARREPARPSQRTADLPRCCRLGQTDALALQPALRLQRLLR